MDIVFRPHNTAAAAMTWTWPALRLPGAAHMEPVAPPADAQAADAACIAQARAGHPQAFDRLVETYSTRIYTHLFRLVRSREEAEDLTQETFIRAFRFLHQYDGNRPFRNWLYAIATNVGLNAIRSWQRRGRFETLDDGHAALANQPGEANPERDASRGELRARIADAMESLPPQVAMLMHLFYYEGMSVAEAAEIVGMREPAAKVALHRARKRLREQLVDMNDE